MYQHKGHDIFVQQKGEGTALLLLHGFPTASWDWHKVWQPLADEYHVIALDFLGFGFSAKPQPYPYSIMDQADICEGVLDHLGIHTVHILAHDYGDTVAQELIARHNERIANSHSGLTIQSVCFLNGGLFPETHQPKPIQKLLLSPLGPFVSLFMGKGKLRKTFHEIFGPNTPPTEKEIDKFWHLLSREGGKKVIPLIIRYMPERVKYRARWVGALQETHIPLRLINGTFDPISGRHMAQRYAELIPNPDIILLEGIGHYPQIETPDQVVRCYRDFRNNQV